MTNVPFDIVHSGITTTVTENEQLNGAVWVPMGAFDFAAGTGGSVTLRTTGTNGYVVADAVEFVKVQTVEEFPNRIVISNEIA